MDLMNELSGSCAYNSPPCWSPVMNNEELCSIRCKRSIKAHSLASQSWCVNRVMRFYQNSNTSLCKLARQTSGVMVGMTPCWFRSPPLHKSFVPYAFSWLEIFEVNISYNNHNRTSRQTYNYHDGSLNNPEPYEQSKGCRELMEKPNAPS